MKHKAKIHTQINLPLGFGPLALFHQDFPLSGTERLSLNLLSPPPPLLLQLRVLLHSLHRPHLRVHGRGTHSDPLAVDSARPKRRVLGLPQPDGSHSRVALGVAVPEIEGQIRMYRLLTRTVEGRRRAVLGFLLFLGDMIRVRVMVLGVWGKGGWGFEGVAVVEFRGVGEVAREKAFEWVWLLAGELGEKHGGLFFDV